MKGERTPKQTWGISSPNDTPGERGKKGALKKMDRRKPGNNNCGTKQNTRSMGDGGKERQRHDPSTGQRGNRRSPTELGMHKNANNKRRQGIKDKTEEMGP